MVIKRRFSGWQDKKTKKAVNVDDVIREVKTGDYYVVKGFGEPTRDDPIIKVLDWNKRRTGTTEVRKAEEFNVEYV